MISVEHKKEIRDYLLSKKLPLDILMELEDHFLTQIDTLRIQNISFKNAFDEVKQIWKEDLKLEKAYNGKEIAVFVKDTKDKEMVKIFRKSFFVFLMMNAVVFMLCMLLEKEVFSEILPVLIMVLTSIPAIHFLRYINNFNYVHQFKKIKLNIFHSSNAIIILGGAFQPFLLGKYGKIGLQIYKGFEQNSLTGILSLIIFSGCVGLYSYGFFIQMAFMKSLRKMKLYLSTFNL